MSRAALIGDHDADLLVHLLALPSVNPLERGAAVGAQRLRDVQLRYAEAAAQLGFSVVHHGPASVESLGRAEVPESVRIAARTDPRGFLAAQPNLVLRLGAAQPRTRTIMFNVHLDTVAGDFPVRWDSERFVGRGAIDAKGLAVGLLAGVREALRRVPQLGSAVSVLIQGVSGEEAGCMGVYGTLPLVEAGYVGAVNVFCEPTRLRFMDRVTASMTARMRVDGLDCHDDTPGEGHNATVLLAWLTVEVARRLLPRAAQMGASVCIGGVHTGDMHNRVYGAGSLLINIAYGSDAARVAMEHAVEEIFAAALDRVATECRSLPWLERTACDARRVVCLEWVKRGLPVLTGQSADDARWIEQLGIVRSETTFTCDAIWMHEQEGYSFVYGPGDLSDNCAHADGEFVTRAELEAYAAGIADLLCAFYEKVRTTS
jgi:acetylornithine deacetylase/succinyl-diaminopimelate desuccinylase-like protein